MSNTENNNAPLNSNSASSNNTSSYQGGQQQRGYRAGNNNQQDGDNNNNNNNNYRGGGRGGRGGGYNNNNNNNYRGGRGRGNNNNYQQQGGQDQPQQQGDQQQQQDNQGQQHHNHHHHRGGRGRGGNNFAAGDGAQEQGHHHHHNNNHRGGGYRGGRGGGFNNYNNDQQIPKNDNNTNDNNTSAPSAPAPASQGNQQQNDNNYRGGGYRGGNNNQGGRGGGRGRGYNNQNATNSNQNDDGEEYNEYRRPPPQNREPRSNNYNQQYSQRPPRSASEEKAIEDLFTQRHKQTGTGINFERYAEIPVQISPKDIEPVSSFAELKLHPLLTANIQRTGYTTPSPVQKYGIPVTFANKDIMGCAQTGSGKTAAFVLPVINYILETGISHARGRTVLPYSVILAPTRELADQIYKEALKFSFKTDVRPQVCYGGVDFTLQAANLIAGCDLVIATPGRLKDMYERKRIGMDRVKFLVLDEADHMLDLGFEDDIRYLVSLMPDTNTRQTMLYSATFPKPIQILARQFLKPDFYLLKVGRVGSTTKNIVQRINSVAPPQKTNTLLRIINNSAQTDLILVFVATKAQADDLSYALRQEQLPCTSIHGDRKQYEREDALAQFKSGEIPIMIATDVASRGLDIPNVSHVIQYDLPNTLEDYTHRIGRTGRAGNQGTATAFYCDANRGLAPELYNYLKEHEQEVPEFLEDAVNDRFAEKRAVRGGGRRGGNRGGGGFAPDPNKSWGDRSAGGGRGGGGGEEDFFNDSSAGRGGRGGRGGSQSAVSAVAAAVDDGGF